MKRARGGDLNADLATVTKGGSWGVSGRARPAEPTKLSGWLGGRLGRVRLFAPLHNRDFAFLWLAMAISLLGDGVYCVAIVWETLRLSNTATAVSIVGVAWTLPMAVLLLAGGTLSDRYDRTRLMMYATGVSMMAVGAIGALAFAGEIRLWMLLALVALYGGSQALFLPAFEAIVPTLVGHDEIADVSALDEFTRTLALYFAGPALGGLIIALAGPSVAFLVDAGSFCIAGCALVAIRSRGSQRRARASGGSSWSDVRDALRFAARNWWLTRTLVAAAVMLLAFVGPYQVLLPVMVKNVLHSGSGTFATIRALGGLGAAVGAISLTQARLPRRLVPVMFVGWTIQCLTLTGYAIADRTWILCTVALAGGACGAVGNVIWGTLMKTRVPNQLLGRVSGLDYLVSISLVPASFALTGPLVGLLGTRSTLLAAGLVSAGVLVGFALLPGPPRCERAVGGRPRTETTS